MRLYDYILEYMENILAEWEDFARKSQPSDGDMDVKELRDHAEEMLRTIAADMQRSETESQTLAKSKGEQPESSEDTAAQNHGDERLESGFSISLLVAEYRALRASVLRLWSRDNDSQQPHALEDVVRFNEAIDQALAESTDRYSDAVRVQQDVFIGTLGHDLRAPLQALSSGAQLLMYSPESDSRLVRLGTQMHGSTKRMANMINNLLDFTQSRIGSGMDIDTKEVELAALAKDVVEEFQSYNPDREIQLTSKGNSTGNFDGWRVARVYQNLIGNALQHGAKDNPVRVSTEGDNHQVIIKVHNLGAPIPKEEQSKLFELLYREPQASRENGSSANLGLGLYIVREIVSAHGGSIELSSSEHGTEFVVQLPKGQESAQGGD